MSLGERRLAQATLDDPHARRLMTIPGVDMAVAIAIVAIIETK